MLRARRRGGSQWRLGVAAARFDGRAADPTIREISMVSGAFKAAKKGGWHHSGEAANPNSTEHHIRMLRGHP